jgi:glyoxylase-like metal-dependent hydrolase (beta-lactamase superfamily II)
MPILHALEGNRQWLDGGAMFGNVPRALWTRWCPPDAKGRIELACRALLVDEGERKVLLETGVGAFFEPALRERFGILEAGHVLLDALARRGLGHEDIDVVVLSHLHFDHAGGLLAPWREDADAELLFPRAHYVVGARALERARQPHMRDRASFIPGLVELLEESGRLVNVDGESSELLGDGYAFRESEGHTPGMFHTLVRGAQQSAFYCADLVPGTPWVHLPVTMGYDRFPERLIEEKRELFEELLDTPTWLFFTHDPTHAAARLERDAKGRYRARTPRPDLGEGLDLDAAPAA